MQRPTAVARHRALRLQLREEYRYFARLIITDEAQNVIVLKDAYDRWAESKGDSADHWTSIFADKIKFGSLAGGEYGAAYLTAYQTRASSPSILPASNATGR